MGFLISFVTRIGRGIFRIAVRERLFLVQNIFSNDASKTRGYVLYIPHASSPSETGKISSVGSNCPREK